MFASSATSRRVTQAVDGLLVAVCLGAANHAGRGAASVEAEPADQTTVIAVVGAAGEEEFGQSFSVWARRWEEASRQAGARLILIGQETNAAASDRDRLQQTLQAEAKSGQGDLWVVLLGHGTFDGREAKFNLRGPDVSANDLAAWLDPVRRPLAVINASASSAPFLAKLSRPGRVVVTATRSGSELNFARFGQFFSEAIADLQADLDKDGQVSLLEAYLTASARVAEFYETEGRLATEHALLDDNGDGLGTPATFFRGVRAVKRPKDDAQPDGVRAHQFHLIRSEVERQLPAAIRARRDALELSIAKLREAKNRMKEDEYYRSLEALLLEMARLTETGVASQEPGAD
jgi:hypothetical protein